MFLEAWSEVVVVTARSASTHEVPHTLAESIHGGPQRKTLSAIKGLLDK